MNSSNRRRRMAELPQGTVTLVFTDIEGSTRLLASLGSRYEAVLADHRKLLRAAFSSHAGIEVDTQGDALFYAFSRAQDAVTAAVAAQRALASHDFGEGVELRVRMGIHTGEPSLSDEGYVGSDVHLGARISAVAWGGQVVVSSATAALVGADADEISLRSLGEHALKDIDHRVELYQVVASGLREDFPALRSVSPHPTNLPTRLAPLIGRKDEIAAVGGMLSSEEVSVVTLVGPGGTGKTRLALAVGAELLSSFGDGVFFVDLSALSDASLVVPAIAQALSLREAPGRSLTETLDNHLSSKKMVLILDNFEQVMDAAGEISALVGSSSSLKVVVTSREALRIEGEREFPLHPLALPSLDSEVGEILASPAVELFVARARAVRPGLAVGGEDARHVAAICRRLDGLPLAIELAAARVKVLPLSALAARLETSLAALGTGRRDASDRQRTLQGAIAWSYELLDGDEQRLFARLGVFAAGWGLEAAESVCDRNDLAVDVLDGIASLVDKSLVRVIEGDEARFSMLETIREFSLEKLEGSGEAEDIRRTHAEYFRALAEEAEPHLVGAEQKEWLDRLEGEHDNMRAMFRWYLAVKPEAAARAGNDMWFFWNLRGYVTEGRRWMKRFLSILEERTPERLRAAQAAALLAEMQEDYESSVALAQEALSLAREFGDDVEAARALIMLGHVSLQKGELERASHLIEEAASLGQGSRNDHLEVRILINLANLRSDQGRTEEAIDLYESGAQLAEAAGDRRGQMMALLALGEARAFGGDTDNAKQLLVQALSLAADVADPYIEAIALINLGVVAVVQGGVEEAVDNFGRALQLATNLRSTYLVAGCLDGLAAATSRNAHQAARLFAISESLRTRASVPRSPLEQEFYEPYVVAVRGKLEERSIRDLRKAADAMTLDAVAASALDGVG
jgi:predicted ATPase/class 3 adenylate cyclase